ncbi:hypothetical protein BDM02DRAFT_3188047 [Thelephora ganbajun]|uniref:Uncharacterized protein n=1 Tax=Thelephora ganbajun TaxID=370292 RepID=A0ACB6ZCP7_THEGA|nr:hypothetical protein BDM02DRAFT_3188047 [Thelephora ganbajun]
MSAIVSITLMKTVWIIATLMIALIVATLRKIERFPNIDEILQYCFRIMLIFMKLCIEIGYLVLGAADAAILDVGDAL